LKSDVSDLLEVLHAVYLDACSKCPAVSPDLRDWKTIQSRVKGQGLSFLTITLPSFCKDFEKSLADGFISPTSFEYFRKTGSIPAFLQGLIGKLFDRETGRLHEEIPYAPTLVEAVRQICLLFKKVGLPCSHTRTQNAIENFVQVERDFQLSYTAGTDLSAFAAVSDVLWAPMLSNISDSDLVPKHGPGATAEHISGNGKYVWQYWYERLDQYFPFYDYAYSLSAFVDSEEVIKKVTFVQRDDESPVRVITVPKTLKSPRIIAIEPVCMQYAQQSIQSVLYERIESDRLVAGHVNFTDQSINQRLALLSSQDGRFATIDLNDASDRVPLSVVSLMFRSNPWLWDCIEACRSDSAKLPDGRLIGPLKKFASMGSALCFPVESMYFYTICVVALLRSRNLPINIHSIREVRKDVYVYGDDLIVPTTEAGTVLDHLQRFNCKVNNSKTFFSGKFRESCGVDAYDGVEVTPTYLRHLRPKNRQQARELISWVATANHFARRGYYRTASLMFCTCETILGPLPDVASDSSCLGRISFTGFHLPKRRVNGQIQAFEYLAWVPSTVYRSDEIDGYPALTKCLLRLENGNSGPTTDTSLFRWSTTEVSSVDHRHLERTAQRGAVTLKRRWVPLP